MSEEPKVTEAAGDPVARPGIKRAPLRTPPSKPQRVFSTSMNPDRAPAQSLDPVLTRKGGATAHKGVLFMAAFFVVLMAIAFNVGGIGDVANSFWDSVNRQAQSENGVVVSTIILIAPYVGAALVGLFLYAIVRALFRSAKSVQKSVRLAGRQTVGIHDFVAEAKAQGISMKVSREAYALLLPHYKGEMRAQFADRLDRDLHLNAHEQLELYAGLLRKSDRVLKAMEDKDSPQPETVLELLKAVNDAPVRAAMKHPSALRQAFRDRSFIRPAKR